MCHSVNCCSDNRDLSCVPSTGRVLFQLSKTVYSIVTSKSIIWTRKAISGKKHLHQFPSLVYAVGMNLEMLRRRQTVKISNGRTPPSKTSEGQGLMTMLSQLFTFMFTQSSTDIFQVPAITTFCNVHYGLCY